MDAAQCQLSKVCLASAVHDEHGSFVSGIRRAAPAVRDMFAASVVNVSTSTAQDVVDALVEEWGAEIVTHVAGTGIGTARRVAVEHALSSGPDRVMYSDLDHVMRWLDDVPDEVADAMRASAGCDLLIVGRSESAFARSPDRLRATEALVNQIYYLTSGRRADLMFATRFLSASMARGIVDNCRESSIASDVEWPLWAEANGFNVDAFDADGLQYRSTADFDRSEDTGDDDPVAWIQRVRIAMQHVSVLERYLGR